MSEKLLGDLPEIFVSTAHISKAVSRAVRQGTLRQLGSRLYTNNLHESPERLVRRHVWQIVSDYVPGALIADRTAIENAPAKDGSVFLVGGSRREIVLPGITIKQRKGAPALDSDRPFIGQLKLSSMARAWLDNMMPSRAREGQTSRTLNQQEIEERLDALLRRGGEGALNRLRDDALTVARQLDMEEQYQKLSRIISAFLGTRTAKLETAEGQARQRAAPFDPDRLHLFEALHMALRAWPPMTRVIKPRTAGATATLAFYEAYFSNFIEGTEFDVEEAASIVFEGRIPSERPQDAHDILGTWRVVSDAGDMCQRPHDLSDFLALLRDRHATIMEGRPDASPGQFKTTSNRAGSTVFVAPDLVRGTFERGFALYQSLESAFARAVFMMFLVAEVHPFADGNGRLARVMMNAELIAGGEERLIVPTVYRNNYLSALKALSQNKIPEPLIRTLDFAQKWTCAVDWHEVTTTQKILRECNAFLDPVLADHEGIRLILPR